MQRFAEARPLIGRRRFLALAAGAPLATRGEPWRDLWDGKSFSGWETFLRGPAEGSPAIGLNRDPNNVFSIVEADGTPAIRISGQDWGALTTLAEFEAFHFRVEFKWGEKKWAPRENWPRDSGILYHCVPPHGVGSRAWMRAFEMQIQEGDSGDFHSVARAVLVDLEGEPAVEPTGYPIFRHKPGSPLLRGVNRRTIKAFDAEKPRGAWNVAEVLTVGDTAVHVVNGRTVMTVQNLRIVEAGRERPLRRGRLQLQSEGAEIFYRRPQIRRIEAIPRAYRTA